MPIRWKNIWKTIYNFIVAVLMGKLLMRLRATRSFPIILFAFVLMWFTIMQRMGVENTMRKVEHNKDIIEELKIEHANMTLELASFNRISKIEELLEAQGSTVAMPGSPALTIEK